MSNGVVGVVRHPDFPKYLIFPTGEIVSRVFKRPRKLRQWQGKGYNSLRLLDSTGTLRTVYIHLLVAEAFHGPAPDGMECRHLDGNKYNNAESNLAWGTRSQNMHDKEAHGTATIGERHPMAKMDARRVIVLRKLHRMGLSAKSLMRYFGISRMTHWRIVNNKLWRHV